MITKSPASVLAMVGGRNVTDGRVDTALEIRTYSPESGRVRITGSSSKGRPRVRTPEGSLVTVVPGRDMKLEYETVTGTQLTTYLIEDRPGSQSEFMVSKIEFREGDGPWRRID